MENPQSLKIKGAWSIHGIQNTAVCILCMFVFTIVAFLVEITESIIAVVRVACQPLALTGRNLVFDGTMLLHHPNG